MRRRAWASSGARGLTEGEQALFEAGIKLGGLFHQFVGTPVSVRTARTLARAIEAAVSLQPYVESVHLQLDPRRGPPSGTGRFGYRYLTAEMIRAEVRVRVGGARVRARLSFREDLRYPLMEVLPRSGGGSSRGHPRSG